MMPRAVGLLLIASAAAGAAYLATRPTYGRLEPESGGADERADAGPRAAATARGSASASAPSSTAGPEGARADRPEPIPATVSSPPGPAAGDLARSPNGRTPATPSRAPPTPDRAPDGGPARPFESEAGLGFEDPPVFVATAFVPMGGGPHDVRAVVGRVLRPDGTAAVSVTVRLVAREKGEAVDRDRPIDPSSLAGRRVLGRTTTSATGEFGFSGVNVDEVVAVVDRSPGLAHATGTPRLSRRDGPASVVLRPAWRTVLRVTDPDGTPVQDADVAFFDGVGSAVPSPTGARPREPIGRGIADLRGVVEFLGGPAPGTEGRLVVSPGRPTPSVLRREIERFALADATVVLPRAYTVRGVVRDPGVVRTPAGRPLREIAAWFRAEGRPWAPIELGDDGGFALRGLARGPVRLLAHPKDLRALDEGARETVVAAGAEDVVLDVDSGETFEIHVTDLVPWPGVVTNRGQAWWKLHGVEASPATVAYRELDGEGVAAIRGVRPGDALDVYIPQAGAGDRCVYETDLRGATRRVGVKTKALLELDGRVEGVKPEMQRRSLVSARADGWDFAPTQIGDAIRGYVPPVAMLRVVFETRWPTGGGAWEVAEGHADVDPRRPFTIRVESAAKR